MLTDVQRMLKDSASEWAAVHSPVSAYRALRHESDDGRLAPVIAELAELGWLGAVIPEQHGGSGLSFSDFGVLLEELGKTLTLSPMIGSALACVSALLICGTEEQQSYWLPRMAAGEAIGALSVDESGRHDPASVGTRAVPMAGGWRITGRKVNVPEGMLADFYILTALVDGASGAPPETGVFIVGAGSSGLIRRHIPQIDERFTAELDFRDVEIATEARLRRCTESGSSVETVIDHARVGLAAEMLGATVQAFETTREYLGIRNQFGVPIGSFQALQHRMADMLGEIELTRSVVSAAFKVMDDGVAGDILAEHASLAKVMANDTFRRVSNEMVQLHGGIGMTDAHDAGLYLKRSRAAGLLYGDTAYHRSRLALLYAA